MRFTKMAIAIAIVAGTIALIMSPEKNPCKDVGFGMSHWRGPLPEWAEWRALRVTAYAVEHGCYQQNRK